MRTCPKCGDFYAGGASAFCPADGTPLADLDPRGETWSEAVRVVGEKQRVLRRRERRLKWRRVAASVVTTLVVTLVVCVAAVSSYIYLRPTPKEIVTNAAPTPDASETSTPTPTATPTPTPTATPTPTPTPTPTCSEDDKRRESKSIVSRYEAKWRLMIEAERARILDEHLPADFRNANVRLPNVNAGSRNAAPVLRNDSANLRNDNRVFRNDNARSRNENRDLRNDNAAGLPQRPEARLGRLGYTHAFSETCAADSVAVSYVWEIVLNVNGTPKVLKRVAGGRRFDCVKRGDAWRCG
ncbi:MAG TPA: hypothetical protein VEQ42_04200 [Pyrinomonadaceae bacterium]|nr:hypothetical protein [Pyrinomonadaceae bacterium]